MGGSFNTKGAVSGASTGAAIGSVFPGYGTVIGAGIGGVVGGFSGMFGGGGGMDRTARAEKLYGGINENKMHMPSFGAQYHNYDALADRYRAQGSSFRGDQQNLGRILAAEAQGNGVGQRLVGMQARTAADRASAQQYGAVAGARPGMQAMASRNAMLGSAMAQSAVGEQAALGSAQMTLGAQQAYGQHLESARGQDINQYQVNNQSELDAYRQRMQLSQMQQQGGIEGERLRAQRYGYLVGANQPTQSEINMGGLQGLSSAIMQMNSNRPANDDYEFPTSGPGSIYRGGKTA